MGSVAPRLEHPFPLHTSMLAGGMTGEGLSVLLVSVCLGNTEGPAQAVWWAGLERFRPQLTGAAL